MRGLIRTIFLVALLACVDHAVAADGPGPASLAAVIDRHIDAKLKAAGIEPAQPSSDPQFLRRIYLDLHGVVPPADLAAKFIDDSDLSKRAKLIDALLASPRYGEHLADQWRGYLISPLAELPPGMSDRFRQWLAERFNTTTWDRTVTDLLTATGTMEQNPGVSYLVEGRHPRTVADLTDAASRYFLGVRLNCAQCHDHPFVKWTKQDYWGMAAFFAQVQTPGKPKMIYTAGIKDDPKLTLPSLKEAAMLDGYLPLPPTYLGGSAMTASDGPTARGALAQWMISPKNPWFAKAMVNRTWWRLFGRGLVDPVDDMHLANEPSHPQLLEELSVAFIESGFDLKTLTKAMVSSRAYQRASGADDAKQERLFGRMAVKVLSPGQLYDSLVATVGAPSGSGGALDHRTEFARFFAKDGDPDPVAYERGIPHALRLMNARQFKGNLAALVTRLSRDRKTEEVAEQLYLTFLSRRPSEAERKIVAEHLREAPTAEAALRDLAWALIVSSEFSLVP